MNPNIRRMVSFFVAALLLWVAMPTSTAYAQAGVTQGDIQGIKDELADIQAQKKAAEERLAASGRLCQVEILKTAHHGSRHSSTEAFLNAVRPEVSLISCSAANRYGHPGEETLQRIREAGSRIYITKDCGAIRIWTDGKKVRVKSFRDL